MLPVLLFSFIAVASAQVMYTGTCPDIQPVHNFDFSAYAGKWYEIAKYPNAAEEGASGQCTTAEYLVKGNTGKVRNTHVVDGLRSYIKGDVTIVGPGKVMLTYTFGGKFKHSYFTILDTDYKNYAIGYSCKYFEKYNTHQILSWILSRRPTLEGAANAAVVNYLRRSIKLDLKNYILNDHSQQACRAYSNKEILKFLD